MEFNSKKLERTSRLVNNLISLILCAFLILLSNKIIDDLDTATARPELERFVDGPATEALTARRRALEEEVTSLQDKNTAIENTIAAARKNYENEKQSFDNWIKTRKTLGSPDKDQEVIARARRLDEYYQVEQAWRAQLATHQVGIDAKAKRQQGLDTLLARQQQLAETRFARALQRHDRNVFLIRLLFVAPILALGIWFFIRFRRHKYWPLFFGFTLFSLYAFFVGLVPYLPSYGGYIRYTVGIALSVGLGYYAIKTIRAYIERRQEELKTSTQVRARNVQLEVAEKALENHYCPSCGKDFIIKKWETPLKNTEADALKLVTDFCRHCGLNLFVDCRQCAHKNFAHMPFCSACGIAAAS